MGDASKGTQRGNGIIATTKHWVNNNQETNRTSDSSVVSDRVEMEMYY